MTLTDHSKRVVYWNNNCYYSPHTAEVYYHSAEIRGLELPRSFHDLESTYSGHGGMFRSRVCLSTVFLYLLGQFALSGINRRVVMVCENSTLCSLIGPLSGPYREVAWLCNHRPRTRVWLPYSPSFCPILATMPLNFTKQRSTKSALFYAKESANSTDCVTRRFVAHWIGSKTHLRAGIRADSGGYS